MTATRTVWSDFMRFVDAHLQGVEVTFSGTVSLIRRRWMVLVCTVLLGAVLGVTVALLMPPQFTASSLLQINTRSEQVTKLDDVVGSLMATDASIRTEVDVLTSRRLAGRVITKLGLMENPDFMAQESFARSLLAGVKQLFFPVKTMQEAEQQAQAEARLSVAINILQANLDVAMQPRSYSIVVRYTNRNPELAAKITNAVAQEYLNSQLEDRFEATRRANEWMNGRIKDMRRSVQSAEMAVEKFREENGLMEAKGVLLSDQQLSELNSQLILSRTQLAEAQARFNRARQLMASGRGIETAAEVLGSPLIMSLREQEAELRRSMTDLASRYGERHPRMQTSRNQLRDLQRKIGEEITKIQGSLENGVAVAQARVKTLEDQLNTLQQKTVSTNASVQLAELERQAEAERTLYESFLNRSKEIAQMDFAQTDARVISAAETPLTPSKPKKTMIVLIGLLLGTVLGAAVIFVLETLDSSFRTATQVEAALTVPVLGVLAELPEGVDAAHYVVDKPTAAFTEGVRAVRTAMQFAHPDKPTKVVLVTSSTPQEGKSVFAMSLAQLTAHSGAKVLLVDADMRRPSIARALGLEPKAGLAELLVGQATHKDVLMQVQKSKLFVLPATPNTQFAQELLASQKMSELVAEWRKQFDLIVIDTPPVMAVADAIALSGVADSLLFMVRWGTTPRALAVNAMRQLQSCNVAVTGTVMTRVDLEKQRSYGHGDYSYYFGKYKEYYND